MKTLSPEEVRVTGSLIEKEITTPDYYPMTVNSLMNACNQKSNRDPVVQYNERMVDETLESLRARKYACRIEGSDMRVPKYRQTFTSALGLTPEQTAVLCVLMLRGAQTVGEIKGRSGRLYEFKDLSEVDSALQSLICREESPLAVKLPRQQGRDARYMHLLCGEPEIPELVMIEVKADKERIADLEAQFNSLREEIEQLKLQFEHFRQQFD